MNKSTIAPHAFDCGDIEAAHQLVEEMHSSPARTLEPPTLLELEHALGGKIENVNDQLATLGEAGKRRCRRVSAHGKSDTSKFTLLGVYTGPTESRKNSP